MDKLFEELIEATQTKINLYAINNNHNGQRAQIEVLNAVNKLYAAYKESQKEIAVKPAKKSTKTSQKLDKKD